MGGFASAGVGKVNGLGNTALFSPPLPQLSHSLNIPPGDDIKLGSIYLDGSAETGVSMLVELPFRFSEYALVFCWLVGGGGRAKGFRGPDAPAERRADAEGEGGGRTIPLCVRSLGCADASPCARAGEPDPDSLSSASEGIVRLSLGLDIDPDFDPPVSLRVGGANSAMAGVVVVARVACAAI